MVVFIHTKNLNTVEQMKIIYFEPNIWVETFEYVVSQVIGRCAVPAFFFMSAMFLYRKPFSWRENMRKKIHTLLIPYFLLITIDVIFHFCILRQLPFLKSQIVHPENDIMNWGVMQWLDAYTGILKTYPRIGPLWFMRDLFVLNVLSVVFVRMIDKFPKSVFVILLLIWLTAPEPDVAILKPSLQSLCFWGLGCLFVREKISLDVVDKLNSWVICAVYFALIVADVLTQDMLVHLTIHRASVLVGIVFWYRFATRITNHNFKKHVLLLSGFNFGIYVFHAPILGYARRACYKIFPATAISQILQYICLAFVLIAFCVMISVFLRKYFPRFYGVITGDRKI